MLTHELGRAEYEALAEFRYALRRFLGLSEEAARNVGLTPQHHQALLAIKGFPGGGMVTVGDLADRLLIRHHSAVELVDRLCQAGLVRREPDRSDRRRVFVSLTEEAERLLHNLADVHVSELQRMRPALEALLASMEQAH